MAMTIADIFGSCPKAQQWQLVLRLAFGSRGSSCNAISRAVLCNACWIAGQMQLLCQVLPHLEEENSIHHTLPTQTHCFFFFWVFAWTTGGNGCAIDSSELGNTLRAHSRSWKLSRNLVENGLMQVPGSQHRYMVFHFEVFISNSCQNCCISSPFLFLSLNTNSYTTIFGISWNKKIRYQTSFLFDFEKQSSEPS